MSKKLVTAIALSLLAHCSPGFSSYDLQSEAGKSSFAHRYLFPNTQKMGTAEEKWWNEFEASKSKNIVQYVHDLSKSNPEAAAWFLLTGGKNGFSNRQATAEEEKLLLGAMKQVSPKLSSYQKAQEWSQRSEIGQLHFGMLFKQMMQMQTELCALHQSNLLLTKEVTQLRSEVRETKVIVQNVVEEVKSSFADQLRKMTEKAEKERQEIISTLAREKEERERDRQREEFRDYHKGLIEVLNRELKHTRSDLNGLIGYEMASDLPTIQRGLKVTTDKMPWKIMTLVGLFLDGKRFAHYDEALKNLSTKLYADLAENQRKGSAEYKAIEDKFKDVEVEWVKQYDLIKKITNYEEERKAKQEWSKKYNEAKDRMKADRSASFWNTKAVEDALYKTKWEEEKRLKAEKDQAEKAERPVLIEQSIEQYGSVRKANQERLKAKYAEWQTKRTTLEALGIETSSEVIQTVNNAFAGLLTTADMRDGLIETLEKRAKDLEKTVAREKRAQEILKAQKTKELQVKARLYNKNYGKGMINDALNQFVSIALNEGHTPEGIESALITHITT